MKWPYSCEMIEAHGAGPAPDEWAQQNPDKHVVYQYRQPNSELEFARFCAFRQRRRGDSVLVAAAQTARASRGPGELRQCSAVRCVAKSHGKAQTAAAIVSKLRPRLSQLARG